MFIHVLSCYNYLITYFFVRLALYYPYTRFNAAQFVGGSSNRNLFFDFIGPIKNDSLVLDHQAAFECNILTKM